MNIGLIKISQIMKIAIFFLSLYMVIPSALTTNQSASEQQQKIHLPSLQQYIENHLSSYSFVPEPVFETKINFNSNDREIYVYSSSEFIQICFQYRVNDTTLPLLLQQRSYQPIQHISNNIRCFQVFSKLQILQQPQKFIIETSSEESNNQLKTQKKNKKQIEYLYNQYLLSKWLHNFYSTVEPILKKISNNLTQALNFDSLNKFSVYLIIHADQKVDVLKLWRQKNAETKYQIVKKLSGRGFHQFVTYTIDLKNQIQQKSSISEVDINEQQCQVQILQSIPHTSYIDVDEMKSHGFKVYLQEGKQGDGINYINIQKPSYESRQYQYKIVVPWALWKQAEAEKYQLKIPVHFRYPNPYNIYSFDNSEKNKKKNYQQYVQIQINPISKAEIVCNKDTNKNVYKLQQNYLPTKGAAILPVGDGAMKSMVNVVTLGSQVICALLLVNQLKK